MSFTKGVYDSHQLLKNIKSSRTLKKNATQIIHLFIGSIIGCILVSFVSKVLWIIFDLIMQIIWTWLFLKHTQEIQKLKSKNKKKYSSIVPTKRNQYNNRTKYKRFFGQVETIYGLLISLLFSIQTLIVKLTLSKMMSTILSFFFTASSITFVAFCVKTMPLSKRINFIERFWLYAFGYGFIAGFIVIVSPTIVTNMVYCFLVHLLMLNATQMEIPTPDDLTMIYAQLPALQIFYIPKQIIYWATQRTTQRTTQVQHKHKHNTTQVQRKVQ